MKARPERGAQGTGPQRDAQIVTAGPPLSRREFVRLVSRGGLVAGGAAAAGLALHDRDVLGVDPATKSQVRDYRVVDDRPDLPEFSIASGGANVGADPGRLVKAAVEGLGGMARFIKPGDRVTIKPNVGWDRDPRHAANTNPEIIAATVEMCLRAGASRVIVTDASCNDPRRCFTRSGIGRAAQVAGATVLLPDKHRFQRLPIGGKVLDDWPVYRPFLNADKVINVAPVKHHTLSGTTVAMKNWYGLLGGRRNLLHQDIHQSIFDLAHFMRPTLTILDAFRVLLRNGPQGGSYRDAEERGLVAATTDLVAGDAWGAGLLDRDPLDIGYIKMGDGVLGTADWKSMRVKEV